MSQMLRAHTITVMMAAFILTNLRWSNVMIVISLLVQCATGSCRGRVSDGCSHTNQSEVEQCYDRSQFVIVSALLALVGAKIVMAALTLTNLRQSNVMIVISLLVQCATALVGAELVMAALTLTNPRQSSVMTVVSLLQLVRYCSFVQGPTQ